MLKIPKFRHFRTRLIVLIVSLVAFGQLGTFFLAKRENSRTAIQRIQENLNVGASLFEERVAENLEELTNRASLMSEDYAFRRLLLQDPPPDQATVRSALKTYSVRMLVSQMALLSPDASILGSTPKAQANLEHFKTLVLQAQATDAEQGTAFACIPIDGTPRIFELLVVPLYAPKPSVVAWICLAMPIDRAFADKLKEYTQLEVTFLCGEGGRVLPVESTLPPAKAKDLRVTAGAADNSITQVRLDGEPYVTKFRKLPLPLLTPGSAAIALQRSLTIELAPSQKLEEFLEALMLLSLAIAAVMAYGIARSVSQPVQALAAHTQVIASGDYATRLKLDRSDELGHLADAFNRMSEGLAERDRVRDLLDKNVSPEVAAKLLRDGDALGGDERIVTVMFVDLRNFTGISEPLPPKEVLALLNRFLDRMTAIIETKHGIVDKYIGDAIMALFGAPVSWPASADDAIMAAIEMQAALAQLNLELAADGKPVLSFGVGINTSEVVAGKMGSARRMNYSVIGDGVNVAARLQDLTRSSAMSATILVSESTLNAARGSYRTRPLGSVPVRGRTVPVHIFAVDGMA